MFLGSAYVKAIHVDEIEPRSTVACADHPFYMLVICFDFSQTWRMAGRRIGRLDVLIRRNDCLRHLLHLQTCKRKTGLALESKLSM